MANGTDNQAPAGPPFKVYCAGVPKNFAAEDLQPYFDRVSAQCSNKCIVFTMLTAFK